MVNTGTLSIFLALLCQYAAAGYVENFDQTIRPLAEECREYVGASDEDVEKVSTLQVLTSQSQACLQYCAFNKAGLMDGTSLAPEEDILKIYNSIHKDNEEFLAQGPNVVNECVDEASNLNTDDSCLLAYFFRQCVLDNTYSFAYEARS
ncbi:general odorant-binding protein 19d-like [Anabrus simplex]|uniref:general odorant-binding protein 19d-like n=1 Tax=Anabrus simplex TaxID=316456 RepID=UPI0035A2B169